MGHVIVTICLSNLKLKACTVEGELESQEHTFTWDMISNYEADLEEQAFTFQYAKEGKEPRWVRVYSPHVSLLNAVSCFLLVYLSVSPLSPPSFTHSIILSLPQFRYMEQCVDRINEEILWKQPDGDSGSPQTATKQVTSAKKPNKVPISSYNDDL